MDCSSEMDRNEPSDLVSEMDCSSEMDRNLIPKCTDNYRLWQMGYDDEVDFSLPMIVEVERPALWNLGDGTDEDEPQIVEIMKQDRQDEFVQLIKSQLDAGAVDSDAKRNRLISMTVTWCIDYKAFRCAEALLEGKTGLKVDLNAPIYGALPLHQAARRLFSNFTELFLTFGARTDASSTYADNSRSDRIWLPIELALYSIRRRVCWSKEQSVVRLVLGLCADGMYEPIKTLSLLLKYESTTTPLDIICGCAAEGKTIEFAALYVALAAGRFTWRQDGNEMRLRQYVINLITWLCNEECKLTDVDSSELVKCREKKNAMMSIMMLVEIFERADFDISCYIKQWEWSSPYVEINDNIAARLETSGFKLDQKDTDNVSMPGMLMSPLFLERPHFTGSDELLDNQYTKMDDNKKSQWLDLYDSMADFGWNNDDPEQKLQPLKEALESFCTKIMMFKWISEESLFKLIATLCLPKVKEALDNCRFLIDSTKRVNEVACYYAKVGNIVALTILLLLAREKVVDPTIYEVEHGGSSKRPMTFREFINSKLAQCIDFEYRLYGRKAKEAKMLSQLCEARKSAMILSLKVLEIFEKAGVTLENYMAIRKNDVQHDLVVREVVDLLQKAGFILKYDDVNISSKQYCCLVKLLDNTNSGTNKLERVAEKGTLSGSQNACAIISPCGVQPTYLNSYVSCSSLSAPSYQASKARYPIGVPKAMGIGQHYRRNFPTSRYLAPLWLSVRRGIRYI